MSSFHCKSTNSPLLRLGNYDCIGFDLDNTLCEYNTLLSVEMEYNILAKYLVKEKGHDPDFLLKPLDCSSLDFLQKGLIVDFDRGNLLKIAENGLILKASHGTSFLPERKIVEIYGEDRKWEVAGELCNNLLHAYNGPPSDKMRAFLDYFDVPASLAFARIIDSLDSILSKPISIYNVWPDVLAGLEYMYRKESFTRTEESFFQKIRSNPSMFIKKCNPAVIKWLKKIKESKIVTFLITGSNFDFASVTAETCLGKDWQDLFDIGVFYARKPGFFYGCQPFIKLDGLEETSPVDGRDLELGNMYSQGNWQELYQLFSKNLNKNKPKCLYFGDNLIQDVFTPSVYSKCDTVAIVEELMAENTIADICDKNKLCLLASESWGSYFFDKKLHLNTVWSKVINNHSKMCIPSLSVLAQYSLNNEFKTFQTGSLDGYFPNSLKLHC